LSFATNIYYVAISDYNKERGGVLVLGKRLVILRNKKGLTQEQIALIFKMSRSTYAQYEVDRRKPDYDTLKMFADYFNVSTDYLLGLTDDPVPYEKNNEEAKRFFRDAVKDDPELLNFWLEIENRKELKLLFQQVKKLSPEALRDVIKFARFVEVEEQKE